MFREVLGFVAFLDVCEEVFPASHFFMGKSRIWKDLKAVCDEAGECPISKVGPRRRGYRIIYFILHSECMREIPLLSSYKIEDSAQ